jgi:hypothetical protein
MHKHHLLSLLSENRSEEALDLLDRMLMHSKDYFQLVNFAAQYRDLQEQFDLNMIASGDFNQTRSKWRNGMIRFVTQLDDRELLQQLLLLSPDAAAHERLAPGFKRYFPNVAEHWEGEVLQGEYAFVVCNDLFTAPDQQADFDALMERYIQAGYYLLCATEKNPKGLVNNNRTKVHAANSRFALYARVREMIDFVRYFGE